MPATILCDYAGTETDPSRRYCHHFRRPLSLVSRCLTLDETRLDYNVYVIYSERADRHGHKLAMQLRAAYAHLRRCSNQAFSSFGMSSDQYVLLTVLAEDGEATQQHLVRRCYSDTATIGTMVSLLQAKGLVTRTPHPQDGRALRVRLTGAGSRLAKQMTRSSSRIRVELAALFSPIELRSLIEFLDRIEKAMRPPGRKTASRRSSGKK